MRILIAGLGSIGRRHLRNLLDAGEQDILLYRTGRSTLPDEKLADLPVYHDLDEALRQEPQAVIISNPTALHLDVAIPAAEAGCHLLIEKPVSHNLERLEQFQTIAQQNEVRILVGYHFRLHPGLQLTRQLLDTGAIGRPLTVRAHWGEYLPGWHPWEDYRKAYSARQDLGGGVILTLSHPLDYLRWLCGEIRDCFAFTGQLGNLELDVEDTAEIVLRFQNDMLGSLHLDYNQRPSAHTLEIVGSDGTLKWDNTSGGVALFQAESGAWQEFPAPAGFERNHLFESEMRHFLAVARGEIEPICTLEDGMRDLEWALLALHSAANGQLARPRFD
jgi:predicted dehydrogenase